MFSILIFIAIIVLYICTFTHCSIRCLFGFHSCYSYRYFTKDSLYVDKDNRYKSFTIYCRSSICPRCGYIKVTESLIPFV